MKRKKQTAVITVGQAIDMLTTSSSNRKNLQMPGDGRYQPEPLRAYLGYDQFAGWLIIVEFFWMMALAKAGVMPEATARLLTPRLLEKLLRGISTTQQDNREYGRDGAKRTNHDINALLELMRPLMPVSLRRWLHFGATSYDIICTAYVLQMRTVFTQVLWPKLNEVDQWWRRHIEDKAAIVQIGRTHLQHALPITVGFWLSSLHTRFHDCATNLNRTVADVRGKFSGMVGTSASQHALCGKGLQPLVLGLLELKPAPVSTQIAPPEYMARAYHEMVLTSGALANLGEDIRKLQAPEYNEVLTTGSASSTSSTGAHKRNNPIAAENVCGMHVNVLAGYQKVLLTLVSDFQRDLRWSSVMRSQSEIIVYFYQQLLSVERLFNNMAVNGDSLHRNFQMTARQCMGELAHLAIQKEGYVGSHTLVNGSLLDRVNDLTGVTMADAVDWYIEEEGDAKLRRAWRKVPPHIKELLAQPSKYIGDAITTARRQSREALR